MAGSIWERFTHDPRHEEHALLRASDSDRDIANDVLGTAYAEGRLTPEELDERSDQVARAKTLGELPPVIDDLVVRTSSSPLRDKRAEAELRYRRQRQEALFSFITPTLICWVIWGFTSGPDGFPWPLFVMLASGLNYLRVATGREDAIASIERDLEKKERRRLESQKRKELERPTDGPDDPQVNQG